MSDIDINRVQQNIEELQDQNAIDFQQWKRLGQEIERLEGKIKTTDKHYSLLMKKIKADYEKLKNQVIDDMDNIKDDYESLKRVVIDENVQVQLNNKINENTTEINNIFTQLNNMEQQKATKNEVDIERKRIDSFTSLSEGSTTGDAELIDGRVGADGITYGNIGTAIRTQVKNIANKLDQSTSVIVYKNLIPYGDMKDLSKMSGANLVQEENGIRATASSATTLLNPTSSFKIDKDKQYALILDFESNSNVTLTTALFNGTYYSTNNIPVSPGSNLEIFTINRTNNDEATVTLFINSLSACSILFKNILLVPLENVTIDNIKDYYIKNGFFTIGYVKNFYDKQEVYNKDEIDLIIKGNGTTSKTVNLTAYSDSGVADGILESENVFIGNSGNKNAIERAIDSVRNIRNQKTIITCIGNFTSDSFDAMLDNDSYGRGYKSFISFNNTFNVTLKGVGNRETKIEILLPDQEGIDYGNYQIVNFDGINSTIENMKIIGKNMRYSIHSDTTGDTNHNEGSNFLIKDCDIKHLGQGTNASASWPSPSGIGLGLSDKTTFTIENCVIQGVQADIVGHDSARATEYKFTAKECIFSMATGTAFNWRLVSTTSKCNATYEFIGCSFGDKTINIGTTMDGVNFYAIVKGYGNSIRFINSYDYLFADEYELKKAYNNDIIKNSVVDVYGNYSNGILYGLALDNVGRNSEIRVLTKGLVNINNIRVKVGEVFNSGDFVTAENGEIKKSDNPTRWSIFEMWGEKYLRIE